MSTIFCVIDGMTDAAFRAADYAALSAMRLLGDVQTTPDGYDTESLTCILTLLGVKRIPRKLRGYAEARGADLAVEPSDLILRGSWFSVDPGGAIVAPANAPTARILRNGAYHWLEDYKSLVVLPGLADALDSIKTRPPYRSAGRAARDFRPEGHPAIERMFDALCTDHMVMIPWGESAPVSLEPFPQKAAVACGTNIVRGIARMLGMRLMHVPGATGDVDTDLSAKVDAAMRAADEHPFVLLHVNGADEAAHRRDPAQKYAFLQKVDALVLNRLLDSRHEIFVASDHGSDPVSGQHIGSAQPVFARAAQAFTLNV
ncbi:MAG: hypothetical protein ACOYI5_02275 [Christensenellales bacterium]|jgi:2,3-bisphosphoglycerate-independent phosphoglycerate mutase